MLIVMQNYNNIFLDFKDIVCKMKNAPTSLARFPFKTMGMGSSDDTFWYHANTLLPWHNRCYLDMFQKGRFYHQLYKVQNKRNHTLPPAKRLLAPCTVEAIDFTNCSDLCKQQSQLHSTRDIVFFAANESVNNSCIIPAEDVPQDLMSTPSGEWQEV